MIRRCASTFPKHKYDFGDCVFVSSIQEGGTVEGIWQKKEDITWRYCVSGLQQVADHWWTEDELKPACPHCFFHWQEPSGCSRCGLMPTDLI